MNKFETELSDLINRHGREKGSNTPDFILAAYMRACLENFNATVNRRDKWYGVSLQPGPPLTAEPCKNPVETGEQED